MHIVIITGLSGSGKTLTLNTLEDQNYYCIDNLPPQLLPKLLKIALMQQRKKIAVGIDIRSGIESIQQLPKVIAKTKSKYQNTEVVYLYARTEIIRKRYNETRRRHPLAQAKQSLNDSLKQEQGLFVDISNVADLHIDTSKTDIYQLSHLVKQRLCGKNIQGIALMFQSFGFKHSAPCDSDFTFDVRCLPNPYWVSELRKFSGQDQAIKDWLSQHESVKNMVNDIQHFLKNWIPSFEKNQKAYMTISIGCTGGHHRSVYIVEQLADIFAQQYAKNSLVHHRELSK